MLLLLISFEYPIIVDDKNNRLIICVSWVTTKYFVVYLFVITYFYKIFMVDLICLSDAILYFASCMGCSKRIELIIKNRVFSLIDIHHFIP